MDTEIISIVKKYVGKVFEVVSSTYDIPVVALNKIFEEECVSKAPPHSPKDHPVKKVTKEPKELKSDGEYSEDYLRKCTKDELARLCKLKKQKTTGNKDDLIKRLIASSNKPIVQKMFKCSPIHIIKNEWGNRVHPQTRLVFSEDKIVIGIQNDNGTIGEVTPQIIDTCNQYKFKYKLPLNLDSELKSEVSDKRIADLIAAEAEAEVV